MKYYEQVEKCLDTIFGESFFEMMQQEFFREEEASPVSTEEKYHAAYGILRESLTSVQKIELKKLEDLHCKIAKAHSAFAAKCGMFAAFHQYFGGEVRRGQRANLLLQHQKNREYAQLENDCARVAEELADDLYDYAEQIKDIDAALDDRSFGIARLSYYFGYRMSVEIIESIFPEKMERMMPKILMTEYMLGFTEAYMNLEYYQ